MLWAGWTAAAAVLLFANPLWNFSWAELVACIGSLTLSLDDRTRRETLLAIGLPAIALLVVMEGPSPVVLRLVTDWFVFIGAVLFGARAVDDQRELEAIAGQLALGPDAELAMAGFRKAVGAEIARARRHERSFVLLSFAPHPRTMAKEPVGESRVLYRLAEARWVLELASVLSDEVHHYSSIVAADRRVLCLVPEVEEAAVDLLVKRLSEAAAEEYAIEVESGVACFPRDALGVDDLIEAADESRRKPRLESVPSNRADANAGASDGGAGTSARSDETS